VAETALHGSNTDCNLGNPEDGGFFMRLQATTSRAHPCGACKPMPPFPLSFPDATGSQSHDPNYRPHQQYYNLNILENGGQVSSLSAFCTTSDCQDCQISRLAPGYNASLPCDPDAAKPLPGFGFDQCFPTVDPFPFSWFMHGARF
jgi:hypothetical protein